MKFNPMLKEINYRELIKVLRLPLITIILTLSVIGIGDWVNSHSQTTSSFVNQPSKNQRSLTLDKNGNKKSISKPPKSVSSNSTTINQTTGNNSQLALLCSQAQNSYDRLLVNSEQQENSEISYIESSNYLTVTQKAQEINQFNKIYNTEVSGEYAGYLKQVRAVPGCVTDFQKPILFQMLPTN